MFVNHLVKTVLETYLEDIVAAREACQEPDLVVNSGMVHLEAVGNHRQRDDLFRDMPLDIGIDLGEELLFGVGIVDVRHLITL